MNALDQLKDWINANPGRALGIAAGAVIGILVLTIGAIKVILVVLFILLGYLIGRLKDENTTVSSIVKDIFRKR
jgi:uncharacterized membrane protein